MKSGLVSDRARAGSRGYAGPEKQWYDKACEYIAKHWKYLLAAGIAVPAIAIGAAGKKMHITSWDVYSALTERPAAAVTDNSSRYDDGIKLPDGSTATLVPATATPTQKPPLKFLKTDDGLATVECASADGCTEEEMQRYLDEVRKLVSTGGKITPTLGSTPTPVSGVVADTNGKRLFLVSHIDQYPEADGGEVRVEWEYDEGKNILPNLAKSIGTAYRSVAEALQPSKKPNIYVTVSKNGKKANITWFDKKDEINIGRKVQTAEYPWVIRDDYNQIKYEMALDFNRRLKYLSSTDVFLREMLGHLAFNVDKPDMGVDVNFIEKEFVSAFPAYYTNKASIGQVGLGADVYTALVIGFDRDKTKLTKLISNLEGKRATWEQFKAEADAVAGRHLETLDYIDQGVKLWRESKTQK